MLKYIETLVPVYATAVPVNVTEARVSTTAAPLYIAAVAPLYPIVHGSHQNSVFMDFLY